MEIAKSKNGNTYAYEPGTRFISLISEDLANCINGTGHEPYYLRKFDYLKKKGLISADDSLEPEYCHLEKKDLTDAVFNTHQIVFEVTDRCNLHCRYCGYGDLYDNYDKRLDKDMSFETFKTLYDYLKDLWNSAPAKGSSYLRISFYGGEPLCNFNLIEKAVEYVKNNPVPGKKIAYSMTTNAILLDKCMDFLAENEFALLISLDGDEKSDSYRVFHNGKGSFNKVIENVDKLKETYPAFFQNYVQFNSVLHRLTLKKN